MSEDPLAAFDYELPPERIAQRPAEPRESARLLVLARESAGIRHHYVSDLAGLLRAGDLLVVNATRVLPARLRGRKASGGAAEALLLGPLAGTPDHWRALLRCRGRLRPGLALHFGAEGKGFDAEVENLGEGGEVTLRVAPGIDPYRAGEPPLPPYIRRPAHDPTDDARYQTIFARAPGAVAAPTAGLHLSPALLEALAAGGIDRAEIVLHVGPGTFRPLRASDLAAGRLHAERFELPEPTAAAIARTRARGGRVVAVGTTTTRVLEARAQAGGTVAPGCGETDLFLRPGARFAVVDVLLTNFHLPRSSLLLLAAAFAGRERLLAAYAEAVRQGYRFYSYGDAMLIQ